MHSASALNLRIQVVKKHCYASFNNTRMDSACKMDNEKKKQDIESTIPESRFRGMLESTTGIPWVVDMGTFQFTYVGPQAEEILGYPVEQWYETDFWGDHIHPDDREAALGLCMEASQKDADYNFEYRMIHRDGHSVWILDYVNIVTEDQKPVRLQGFMFDVSEDRRAKQKLQEQNSLLEALYQASPDMIFIHARDGRILDVNENVVRRYGYSREEMRKITIADVSADEGTLDKVVAHVQSALRGEDPEFEWMAKDNTGTPFPVEIRLRKLDGGDAPDAPAVIAVVREISERRRIENAIKNIAAGVSAQTGQGFYQQLVKHLAKLFEADHAFIGLLDEANPSTVNTLALWSRGDLADNISYSLKDTPCAEVLGEGTCCYPDGVQRKFPLGHMLMKMGAESFIGTPLFGHDNKPIGLIVVIDGKSMTGITQVTEILEIFAFRVTAELERERIYQRLQTAKQKLALHVQQTPLGVIEWDTEFCVTDWNPAAEKIFGYSRQEALGRHARDLLIPREYHRPVDSVWQELLTNRGGSRSTNGNVTKSGKAIVCEWYNTPLVTSDGQVIGVASLVDDISERVHAEAELTRHREHLEEMVNQRTEELSLLNKELKSFGHTISHDLRAPLRHIDGFTKIVMEDYVEQLGEEGNGYLQRVRNNVTHMEGLIESMLQLSRISDSEINRARINLSDMASEVVGKLQQHAPDRLVSFEIQAGLTAIGDAHLVRSVIDNLIGNAWKYSSRTNNAVIQFGARKNTHEGSEQTVYFVRDNGVGFDMKYADILFDTFQRLHSAAEFKGTGVGLATVKRIILRHGGRVWAESDPGHETSFYFTLGKL